MKDVMRISEVDSLQQNPPKRNIDMEKRNARAALTKKWMKSGLSGLILPFMSR